MSSWLRSRDFFSLQETHATPGRADAWPSERDDFIARWSHGSRNTAGIGILVRRHFLINFAPLDANSWVEIVAGRIGCLHLHGEWGSLTIACVYLSAVRPHERVRDLHCPRDHLRHATRGLVIIAGDFNFVTSQSDRWNDATGAPGNPNVRETDCHRQICSEFSLKEWHQPEFTNVTAGVRARIDRVYVNLHAADLLNRKVDVAALS